jgi:protein-tyrosine phosphatase
MESLIPNDKNTKLCNICGLEIYNYGSSLTEKAVMDHSLMHMQLIVPHLYLGDAHNAGRIKELIYFKIDTVINVSTTPNYFESIEVKYSFKYIKYPWSDIESFNILDELDKIISLIHVLIIEGKNVFVHCGAGVSRSVSVVIAYLIKYNNMKYDQAFNLIKSIRWFIKPNSGFVEQYEQLIYNV